MKAVRPIIASNEVPYLQITSEREKKGKQEMKVDFFETRI